MTSPAGARALLPQSHSSFRAALFPEHCGPPLDSPSLLLHSDTRGRKPIKNHSPCPRIGLVALHRRPRKSRGPRPRLPRFSFPASLSAFAPLDHAPPRGLSSFPHSDRSRGEPQRPRRRPGEGGTNGKSRPGSPAAFSFPQAPLASDRRRVAPPSVEGLRALYRAVGGASSPEGLCGAIG